MADETRSDKDPDITDIWKGQPVERLGISVEQIRLKAQKFEKRIFWRNFREYAASAIVIAAFGHYISVFHPILIRAGCSLVIAGTLLMVFALHKRGGVRTTPAELGLRACAEFHRKELERQRDLLRSVWLWYLLPFVPGLIVLQVGLLEHVIGQPNGSARAGVIVATFALTVVVGAVVWKLNHWAANELQREIDALNGLGKES
jgi:hypothetical protein